MTTLLFEIGCEELPASVCAGIERQLVQDGLVARLLQEARLVEARADEGDERSRGDGAAEEDGGRRPGPAAGRARALISPRRVAVLVTGLPDEQLASTQVARGPRADVAFTPDGTPTKAGQGFARSRGVAPEQLGRTVIDGAEFVTVEIEQERRRTIEVVPELCAAILAGLHVPRGMRWGTRPPLAAEYLRFSRPIRWLVCKFGEETVPFSLYDLTAGDLSQGHRVLGKPVTITVADEYERLLEAQCVLVDQARRRELIVALLDERARAERARWVDPGDVLSEAVYLVEWPSVLAGRFDEGKLELPADVLVTAMQSHQRYFPLRGSGDDLRPAFLYVSNADPAHAGLITQGNERVLEGRLDDAGFAFGHDLAEGLEALAGKLAAIVFHEQLGTLADKSARLQRIGDWLARRSFDAAGSVTGREGGVAGAADREGGPAGVSEHVVTAARLAKADLASHVVQEFPVLQGRMGEIYALRAGLPGQVAQAIGEQYLPLGAGAALPRSPAGALLAVADKIDNIAGAWVAGEKPSGSRDPYGLRRAAIGIVRIALGFSLRFPLPSLVAEALEAYAGQDRDCDAATVAAEVRAFVLERLEGLLLDEGVDYECVQAALGADAADIPGIAARARSFAAWRERDIFADAVVAYNRCAPLAAKAGADRRLVRPELFREDAEAALYAAFGERAAALGDAVGSGEIETAVTLAAALRPAIDRYFDDVLVMDPDEAVRANRLAQLAGIRDALRGIGDLSRISI